MERTEIAAKLKIESDPEEEEELLEDEVLSNIKAQVWKNKKKCC